MRALLTTLRENRWWTVGAIVAVLALSAALTTYGFVSADDPKATQPDPTTVATSTRTATPSPTPPATSTLVRWASILNGTAMTEEQWRARKDLLPIAIMLDNTAGAIPHAGLDKADIVYEAFVEGGLTRLMAVYWSQEAGLVLPVRSARTPFVIWVDELGALYGHAGAADTNNDADATGQIFEWDILDLNAFSPGPSTAYNRDPDRYAPYNLATSTLRLREAASRLGLEGPPRVEPWPFKADREGVSSRAAAEALQLDFQERPNSWQAVQWRWDAATNSYFRFQFGGPFVDAPSKQQIRARNIVVMRVPWAVVDRSGHVLLEQFGTGESTVFLDGRAISGTWKKADRRGRTRFYDSSGVEIAFNRGPIWIEVAGPASKLTVSARDADLPPLPPYSPPPSEPPEEPEVTPPASTAPAGPTGTPASTATAGPTGTPASTATPGGTPGAVGSRTPQPTPATSTSAPSSPASQSPQPSPTPN